MRLAVLPLCFAFAACSGMSALQDPAPSTEQAVPPAAAASTVAPSVPPSAQPAPPRRASQSVRGSIYTPPAQPTEPEVDPVLAIRQHCWSSVDRQRQVRGIDARVDWVEKCIAERSKGL